MRTARFLVGVLADRLRERADEARKIELRWRERFEELEASLPDPAERTVEQWDSIVSMSGELYYAIAAASNSGASARSVEELRASLDEEIQRDRR